MLTTIIFVVFVALIAVSYHFFDKWVKEFSGKDKLSTGVWLIVILAAISVPTAIINVLSLLVTCIAWLVMLF